MMKTVCGNSGILLYILLVLELKVVFCCTDHWF